METRRDRYNLDRAIYCYCFILGAALVLCLVVVVLSLVICTANILYLYVETAHTFCLKLAVWRS